MILTKRDGNVSIATINRADKAGALTRQMLLDLADFVESISDAKALILTGEGTVFSAGMDLAAAADGLATDPVWERLSGAIADFSGLSIAALNGTVAGGSMGMVLACDIRLSVPGANFFYPVMKRGFLPQPSDPKRLSTLIGPARAKMILMAGQKISADMALDWGLVDRIISDSDIVGAAKDIAQDVTDAPLSHVKAIQQMIPDD